MKRAVKEMRIKHRATLIGVVVLTFLIVATLPLSAEESDTQCLLKVYVNRIYPSSDTNNFVKAGEDMNVIYSIRNISTNTVVLSLDSDVISTFEGKPMIILSNSIDKITGSEIGVEQLSIDKPEKEE